eukprot:TRINITY_DN3237_c0_g1_i2.p1 TRINITY_DN3237_c0_g1~~TRINITY_DN3237_c0_g1_i2.p1  ORF type:complete len:371 (+),score=116.50 TRINITY_DN3237_c0_g1_i2:168-1280(+)
MEQIGVPGVSISVFQGGKLIFAKGYGVASTESGEECTADSLFRIASVSKTFTAVAILKLIEEGKLTLETQPFKELLTEEVEFEGRERDPRIEDITIDHLLHHTAGWDKGVLQPTMQGGVRAWQKDMGITDRLPTTSELVLWYKEKPLQFEPGSTYQYSNFGYTVLGRVIEAVSGQTYEEYVRDTLLAETGITRMAIGSTKEPLEGEVSYHFGGANVQSIYPGEGQVPRPYGGFDIPLFDAHGGWVASTVDLARFMTCLDRTREPHLLSEESLELMLSRPSISPDSKKYYGCGIEVIDQGDGKRAFFHLGGISGMGAIMAHSAQDFGWAIIVNYSSDEQPSEAIAGQFDKLMWQSWGKWTKPTEDLFDQFS